MTWPRWVEEALMTTTAQRLLAEGEARGEARGRAEGEARGRAASLTPKLSYAGMASSRMREH